MSSISTVLNSAYYQLSNLSSGTGSTTNASNSTDALIQALNGTASDSNSSDNSGAFLLDLSPAAQQYLNGGASSSTDLGTSSVSGNSSFTLTSAQQKTLKDIITKYKDAPYTQDTFNDIQNDLNAAGLSPQSLALQDKAKSFDSTQVLLDALDGKQTVGSNSGSPSDAEENTKSQNFIKQVAQQWQSIAGTGSA
jgi:hypothetical protein